MKQIAVRALVLGALLGVLAPWVPEAAAAGPPVWSTNPADYAATLLAPQNGSTAAGAAAILKGSGAITVAVAVAGLTPMTAHRARIQSGDGCGANGPVVHPLTTLNADAAGDAMAFTTLHASAVPAKGYYVNVLGSDSKQMPVACAPLAAPDLVVGLHAMNGSKVSAVALLSFHAPVAGASTQLGTQVLVYATGLQAKTPQANHIHAGLCGQPSPVRYPLLTLVPDAQGRAVAGTGITDIVPKSGLSVHIHDNSFKVVACGNLGS